VEHEFLSAPRLDNLCSCFCGLRALGTPDGASAPRRASVLALFDHEEVGSGSRGGAASPLLADVLERLVLAAGGTREDYHRAVADSVCVSADMAHATHPNYPDKHEPDHLVWMNHGPAIKVNTSQRYATDGETEALFQEACERADVPFQKFVSRTDLACGSTIGPLTAARIGLRTVDVGNPQLAMHSARELCGAHDPALLVRALRAFYAS
jgi:aspartyl aminopeptidase